MKYYLDRVEIINGEKWILEDVNIDGRGLDRLEGWEDISIKGRFYCHSNRLIDLKGSPRRVTGDFSCRQNRLRSLEGAPEFIGGSFYAYRNILKTLKGSPKEVGGLFAVQENRWIKTLEGISEKIGMELIVDSPKLTTLKGIGDIDGKIRFNYINPEVKKCGYFLQYMLMDKIEIRG